MGTLPLDSKYIEVNGSIRGLSNIYIADGSLLPTAVGESPQLTIMAFVSSLYSNIRPWTFINLKKYEQRNSWES